ncbi:MAG: hypothetical protein JNM93_08475 [Bacteriovoracaceae bacterium]|nr:hypothetical protein [Bacteriovoracaceae bacterium]
MSSNVNHLIAERITPDVAGVFWFLSSELSETSKHFQEFNYILNGLLVSKLANREQKIQKNNFFYSTQFGHPFFVGQISDNNTDYNEIKEMMKLTQGFSEKGQKILILDDTKNGSDHIAKLKKNFPDFKFEPLNNEASPKQQ